MEIMDYVDLARGSWSQMNVLALGGSPPVTLDQMLQKLIQPLTTKRWSSSRRALKMAKTDTNKSHN